MILFGIHAILDVALDRRRGLRPRRVPEAPPGFISTAVASFDGDTAGSADMGDVTLRSKPIVREGVERLTGVGFTADEGLGCMRAWACVREMMGFCGEARTRRRERNRVCTDRTGTGGGGRKGEEREIRQHNMGERRVEDRACGGHGSAVGTRRSTGHGEPVVSPQKANPLRRFAPRPQATLRSVGRRESLPSVAQPATHTYGTPRLQPSASHATYRCCF